jgi:hypothetical protein
MAIEINIKTNVEGGGSVDKLNESINETSNSAKSLRQQFIDARKELMAMSESDPGFAQKAIEAGRLKDQIGDMNAVIKATAGSTTENLGNAFGGVASIGIGAFQGIASAQALFGSESEDLQKVLVRLQAAAGMADAIRSFGQFGDTITQVKASLSAVTAAIFTKRTATVADTTATVAQTAATEGAAVAQAGLNATMLANPIFLVIAAIGALVGAYMMFSSQSEKAAEAEKKRQKAIDDRRKAQEKASKEESKQLASMQSAYALQIGMLSKTNANSKERIKLINDINKEYGTSLKNIKDEAKFQDQLSVSLEKYLSLKRVEFQVKKNEAYFESLMAKESDARKQLAKDDIKITKDQIEQLGKLSDVKTKGALVSDRQVYINKILGNQSTTEYDSRQKSIEQLLSILDEQERVTEATFKLQNSKSKLITTTNNVTNATNTEKEAYKTLADEADKAEEDLSRSRTKRTGSRLDELNFERTVTLDNIKTEYEEQKKIIEKTITDTTKKTAALKELELNYNRWLKAYTLQTGDELDTIYNDIFENRRKYYDELMLAEKTLQTEITFGNNNTADTLEALRQRELKMKIDSYDDELKYGNLSLEEFKRVIRLKEEATNEYLLKEKGAKENAAITERDFQMAEVVKSYDNMGKYIITKDEETGKFKVEMNQKTMDEMAKTDENYLDASKFETEKVEGILNQTAINLNDEANVKKQESNTEFNQTKKENAIQTEEEILQAELSRIERSRQAREMYIESATAVSDAFFTWGDRKREDEASDELSKYEEGTKEYDAAKKRQTQIAEDAAKKQFDINKAFQLGAAINDGIASVQKTLAVSPLTIMGLPNPGGIAAFVATTAMAAANVARIAASRYKSTSSSMPSAGGAGGGGSSTPQLNLFGNPNDQNTVNATTNQPMMNQNQITVKAVVSETDITDTQKRIAKYRDSAEL